MKSLINIIFYPVDEFGAESRLIIHIVDLQIWLSYHNAGFYACLMAGAKTLVTFKKHM